MGYTVKDLILSLIEDCGGNLNMPLEGIRQVNTPNEQGTLFHYHNIGIERVNDTDFEGNPIITLALVSGGNNIKRN